MSRKKVSKRAERYFRLFKNENGKHIPFTHSFTELTK